MVKDSSLCVLRKKIEKEETEELRSTNTLETITRLPVKNVPPNANYEDFINNCVPIFYLKYVDDVGDYSDTKETIGTIIDVVLTFTAVGNIAKLRHIKDVSLLRKVLTGTITIAEELALKRAVSGMFAAFDALMGIAHLAYSLLYGPNCELYYENPNQPPSQGSPNYAQYSLCKEIDVWLFAFEVIALSGDLAAKRAFKRATKRLQLSIPPGNAYDDFREAASDLVGDVDNLLDDFLDGLQSSHPNIYQRIDNLNLDEEARLAFMNDFQGRDDALDALAADPDLIDHWTEVKYLTANRNNILFLKCRKYVKNNTTLLDHIFKGHTYSNGKATGVHSKIAVDNGFAIITSVVDPPNSAGFYKVTVSVKDANNNFIPKMNRSGNAPQASSFFPDDWDEDKIIEEICLAYTNKVRVPNTRNRWDGTMSNGSTMGLAIDGNTADFDNTTKIITVFPEIQ